MSSTPRVVRLDLGSSNVHAVVGRRTVLVDAGSAASGPRVGRALARAGIDHGDIALVVITHCHPDHAGGAGSLAARLGVPVAVHRAELDWAKRGTSELYAPLRPFGLLLKRMVKPSFPAFTPDVLLDDGDDLSEHGVPLRVMHTPGHTPGSITVHAGAGGPALVGDLLAGSILRPDRPGLPYLAHDLDQLHTSIARLAHHAPGHIYPGHGRPFTGQNLVRTFGPVTSTPAQG